MNNEANLPSGLISLVSDIASLSKLYSLLAAAEPDLPEKPSTDQLFGLAYSFSLLDDDGQRSLLEYLDDSKTGTSPQVELKNALLLLRNGSKLDYIKYGISASLRIRSINSHKKGYHQGYCDGYLAGCGGAGGASEPSVLDRPIEMLGLSTGAFNCLSRIGIRYIREVAELEDTQIQSMRNLGAKRAAEIGSALEKAGIRHTAWSRYAVPGER